MPRPAPRPASGFTLIELAIVLAIAVILLRAAAPGMSRSVAAHAVSAQVGEFAAALRFARSEALKRGVVVTMCAADADAAASAPRCAPARAADWRGGWFVFVDLHARGAIDPGDQVLRVQQALARSGGVAGTRASISFAASGISTDASSHYLFSPPGEAAGDAPPAVMVCVSKQGRPRIASSHGCD